MDGFQLAATIIGSTGGGAALLAAINGLVKWFSGSAGRERARNTSLEAQRIAAVEARDKAIAERDEEAAERRIDQDHVAMLRRQLIEAGIRPLSRSDVERHANEGD